MDTIFLIGYMGSGKTVVGKSLSKSINYNFYDLDKFIELNEKKSISEIFTHKNEVYFRKIESEYLNQLISIKEKFALSLKTRFKSSFVKKCPPLEQLILPIIL